MSKNQATAQVVQDEITAQVAQDDEDDFPLPVCQLRPGQEGFETCESCQ